MEHASLGGNWDGGSHCALCGTGSEGGGGGRVEVVVSSPAGTGEVVYFNGDVTWQAVGGESGEKR